MKYVILFLLSISLLGLTALSQSKSRGIPKVPKGADNRCIYAPKYSASKRLQFYPFNISDSIKLVSFRHHWRNYPIKGDSVINDSLIEVKVLQAQDVNKLTDIFYNNFYKKFSGISVLTQCFWPRNAILFTDKAGRLKEYILICFHCMRYELGSERYHVLGDECDEKIEKIRNFFLEQGILFGTNRSIDSYPGETDGTEGTPLPKDNK